MSDDHKTPVLSFFNLSDEYERRARFLPAVLTVAVLLPMAMAFGIPLMDMLQALVAGVGVGAVSAVGLSHVASAMGNRLQRRLWPDWPHDSPTNRWLMPDNPSRSKQQKDQWYAAAYRLSGLDISQIVATGDASEIRRVINDAVAAIRSQLWKSSRADLLRLRNVEYGYARNVTGLRPFWMGGCVVSLGGCLVAYRWFDGSPLWAVTSGILVLVLPVLAYTVLPGYVRAKADYYAEAFFAAMIELDREVGAQTVEKAPAVSQGRCPSL